MTLLPHIHNWHHQNDFQTSVIMKYRSARIKLKCTVLHTFENTKINRHLLAYLLIDRTGSAFIKVNSKSVQSCPLSTPIRKVFPVRIKCTSFDGEERPCKALILVSGAPFVPSCLWNKCLNEEECEGQRFALDVIRKSCYEAVGSLIAANQTWPKWHVFLWKLSYSALSGSTALEFNRFLFVFGSWLQNAFHIKRKEKKSKA